MKQTRIETKPFFSPETGLLPDGTVKEQLQNLLNSGYFDHVDSIVLAHADHKNIQCNHFGRNFDCAALTVYLQFYLQELIHG